MRYPITNHCQDCCDRMILNEKDILNVISDPTNHAAKRRQIIEKLMERIRLKEEAHRMGLI